MPASRLMATSRRRPRRPGRRAPLPRRQSSDSCTSPFACSLMHTSIARRPWVTVSNPDRRVRASQPDKTDHSTGSQASTATGDGTRKRLRSVAISPRCQSGHGSRISGRCGTGQPGCQPGSHAMGRDCAQAEPDCLGMRLGRLGERSRVGRRGTWRRGRRPGLPASLRLVSCGSVACPVSYSHPASWARSAATWRVRWMSGRSPWCQIAS